MLCSCGSILAISQFALSARAVGRGGSATSHLKRYDIDKVYHKSMAGGHPRETVEASFDIIHDGIGGKVHLLDTEVLCVVRQVLGVVEKYRGMSSVSETSNFLWYFRLNHTRLADLILDLCDVGPNESLRRICFHILSRFTAPPPFTVFGKANTDRLHLIETLTSLLNDAVSTHGMSSASATNFFALVESCLPLPSNALAAIDALQKAITKVKNLDDNKSDSKREKRLEDIAKNMRHLNKVILALDELSPIQRTSEPKIVNNCYSHPLYISLDLGLHQRRRNYHGGIFFQCIALPDDYFEKVDMTEHNEIIVSPTGRGTRIAEGGNYSDLVRKNRPPGNFMSTIDSNYAVSRIPFCVGVRFFIGNIVELVYNTAALSGRRAYIETSGGGSYDIVKSDKHSMELLRRSLGHPLQFTPPIHVIVASVHGMDDASIQERFIVASRLWCAGIAAEYLPQSGIALSLVNRFSKESDVAAQSGSSDFSLMELQGVCALLRIPYIAIVQPHLLKDKASVRLRSVKFDSIPQGNNTSGNMNTGNYSEIFVSLDDLPSIIQGAVPGRGIDDMNKDDNAIENVSGSNVRENRSNSSNSRKAHVECIYVDSDQFLSRTRDVSKNDTPNFKNTLKSMKFVQSTAESFLSALPDPSYHSEIGIDGIPVFAVTELSFFLLREMGTEIMRRETSDWSCTGACTVMMERYPRYKRIFRNLSNAVDNYMKQSHNFWNMTDGGSGPMSGPFSTSSSVVVTPSSPSSSSLITILLYSIVDDRFDMMTLRSNHNQHHHHGNKSKHYRGSSTTAAATANNTSGGTGSGYVTSAVNQSHRR